MALQDRDLTHQETQLLHGVLGSVVAPLPREATTRKGEMHSASFNDSTCFA
jgi:hypothetical protein